MLHTLTELLGTFDTNFCFQVSLLRGASLARFTSVQAQLLDEVLWAHLLARNFEKSTMYDYFHFLSILMISIHPKSSKRRISQKGNYRSDKVWLFRFAAFPSEKTTKSPSFEDPTKAEKARSPQFTDWNTSSTSNALLERNPTARASKLVSTPARSLSPS